jgi:hypothetical protein
MTEKLPPEILYLNIEEAEKYEHPASMSLPDDMTGLYKYTRHDDLTDDEVRDIYMIFAQSKIEAFAQGKRGYELDNAAIDDLRKRGMIRRGR